MKVKTAKPRRQKLMSTAEFNKLARAERATLIAKDVIKSIKAGYITPMCANGYITSLQVTDDNLEDKDYCDIDARSAILNNQISCDVCGRAALFLSAVKFKNKLTLEDINRYEFDYISDNPKEVTGTNYLSSEFSKRQQALIETAFEGKIFGRHEGEIGDKNLVSLSGAHKAQYFRIAQQVLYNRNDNETMEFSDFLLIKICKNIIKNNGTFKP